MLTALNTVRIHCTTVAVLSLLKRGIKTIEVEIVAI